MSEYDVVLKARSNARLCASQYIKGIVSEFLEFHGDRRFGDDAAVIGGIGMIDDMPVTVIGIEKGRTTGERIRHNFGSAHPEGYRKALRLMKQAEKFKRPVVCFVDTAGAFCGVEAEKRSYRKGEYVFRQGEHLNNISVLVEGSLHIQRDDYWGNRSIINMVDVGEMFGEAYVAPDSGILSNDVVATKDSTVIFFDVRRMLTVCSSACKFHSMVIQNLFFAISEKNRKLLQKLGHMSKRSTREKLISYLSEEAKRQNSGTFMIPFNRQQLADFLSVDRDAMSNELCKMRDEGMLKFEKNRFTLL